METVKQDAAFVEAMLDRIQGLLLHKLQEVHACSPALRHDLGDSQIFPTPVRWACALHFSSARAACALLAPIAEQCGTLHKRTQCPLRQLLPKEASWHALRS